MYGLSEKVLAVLFVEMLDKELLVRLANRLLTKYHASLQREGVSQARLVVTS